MNDKMHNITSKQMMSFIVSAEIGFGIISLPAVLAEKVGHDGWISVLITGIINIFSIYFIIKFLNRYSNKSIFQINILLYGKFLGIVLNLILFIYVFAVASVIMRLFIEIIKIIALKLTPSMAIGLLFLIPTLYIIFKGLKVLVRFTSLLYFSYIAALLFLIFIANHAKITFVMPIGEAGFLTILKGMYLTSFSYIGFELISIIYPYVKDKNKALKWGVIANIFTTIFFTSVVLFLTMLYGEEKLKLSTFPLYHITTSIRVPILERIDIFFIAFWFPVMGSAVRIYYFSAYHAVDVFLNFSNKKLQLFIFTIFIIVISRIPRNLNQVYKFSNILGTCGIIVVAYLVFSFLFSFINKRGVTLK